MRRTENKHPYKKIQRLGKAAADWRKMITMAGGWLTRFGVRATVITGLWDFSNYGLYLVGNIFNKELGSPLNEAFNVSKVGLGILGVGLAAKYIPNILSSNLEDVAQAGGINSMEDYRKEDVINHLSHLWKKVFEPEARINYKASEIEDERRFIRDLLKKLNYDYQTNKFTAQLLLYPGDENLNFFNDLKPREDNLPPARDGLLNARESLIKRRFGKTFEDADNVLDDMILPTFEDATDVRRLFDAEYIDDPDNRTEFAINYGLADDLELVGCCQRDKSHYERSIVKSRRELVLFTNYLRRSIPKLFDFENAKMLRAMRTAFHINKWGIKEEFSRLSSSYLYPSRINRVEEQVPVFSERLEALRFHQTLTILETIRYQNLLKELAYSKTS